MNPSIISRAHLTKYLYTGIAEHIRDVFLLRFHYNTSTSSFKIKRDPSLETPVIHLETLHLRKYIW